MRNHSKFIIKRRKTSSVKKRRNLKHRSSRVKPKTLKRRAVVKQRIPVEDGGSTTPRTAPPQDQNLARNLADEFDDAADDSMMTLEGISANTRNLEARPAPFMASERDIAYGFGFQYHNVGAPAILKFYPSGRIAEEQWQLNGELSRPGNLPVIVYYADREGSPVYSETYRFDVEHVDEDDEVIENIYLYTRLYLDEDFNELEEPAEKFDDIEGFEIDQSDFEANVDDEGWRDRLVSARDLMRESKPTLSGRTLSWKNRAGSYDRRGGPAVLSFFDSGRLRSEKWYVNGVYQRDGNLPNYVSYRDNSSALTDRVEMEIWKFYNPAMPGMYGTISKRYNNQGELEGTLYGTESGIGNTQMMPQEDWERIYGTQTLVSTIPSQQIAAPQAPVQPIAPRNTQQIANRTTPSITRDDEVIWKNSRSEIHNEGAPAILKFYPSGNLKEEKWYKNDRNYRPNRPATVNYADDDENSVYSETFNLEVEFDDEDGETEVRIVYYTILYYDEDFEELDEPEERFEDDDGDEIEFETEDWRDDIVYQRDQPRNSIPRLYTYESQNKKTVKWENQDNQLSRLGNPAELSFYIISGRLMSEKWLINNVYTREGNLPQIVNYGDVTAENLDRVESESWYFYPDNTNLSPGTIQRRYYNLGELTNTTYLSGTGARSRSIQQEDWERIYGTQTLVSTIPSQQIAAPQAPPPITQPPNLTPSQPPISESFYDSGRVRLRGWTANGISSRENNYPIYVRYADNEDHTILGEDWEIIYQRNPEFVGKMGRSYDMSGNVTEEYYYEDFTQGERFQEYPDLGSFLQAIGRPVFNSEKFGTYDYTIQDWRTPQRQAPAQQLPSPGTSCPIEDINYVREPRGDVDEVPKCKAVFTVDKPKEFGTNSGGDYPLGDILNNLYRECNFLEDREIDNSYIATTVKYLQKKFPLPSNLDINTRSGKEVISAVPFRKTLSSFIPQVDTSTGPFKVLYSDEPGIDYGGMARQFIENLMEKISYVLFDEMKMDTEPYVEILDGMTPEEKKKAMEEADQPRYYITKKSFKEIADSLGMITTQGELNEILALHRRLGKDISESSSLTMNVMETTDIMGALERVSGGMINYKKKYQKILQNSRQRSNNDFSDFLMKELTEDKIRNAFPLFKPEEVYELYELAGNMFAYAAINKVPFKIPLSRILLKKMLNDNQGVSNEEKLAAYILDTGTTLSKDINLRFDYGGDDMEAITEYLTDLEDNLRESASGAYDVDELRLSSFIRGFKKVGDVLKQRNFNIKELNVMICKIKVTEEDMKKLLTRVKFTDFGNDSGLINKVKDAILNIGDYNQLLKWWTGSSVILDKKYEIQLTNLEDTFFNSHTCFFRFDVSRVIINSPNFLINFKREITNIVTTAV